MPHTVPTREPRRVITNFKALLFSTQSASQSRKLKLHPLFSSPHSATLKSPAPASPYLARKLVLVSRGRRFRRCSSPCPPSPRGPCPAGTGDTFCSEWVNERGGKLGRARPPRPCTSFRPAPRAREPAEPAWVWSIRFVLPVELLRRLLRPVESGVEPPVQPVLQPGGGSSGVCWAPAAGATRALAPRAGGGRQARALRGRAG